MANKSTCETCAFTKGAEANKEPHNFIKGQLALHGPSPFYCHHGWDWEGTTDGVLLNKKMYIVKGCEIIQQDLPICQGWRREVAKLAKTGYYRQFAELTKPVANYGFRAFKDFLAGKNKTESLLNMKWALTELFQLARNARREFKAKQTS